MRGRMSAGRQFLVAAVASYSGYPPEPRSTRELTLDFAKFDWTRHPRRDPDHPTRPKFVRHNGLACAAYLAKAGRRVVVVESQGVLGGLSSTEATV